MRSVERFTGAKLDLTPLKTEALGQWLREEHEISRTAYSWITERWLDSLRMYNGWPRDGTRMSPRENAPNIEITICAMAADVICAQFIDLYFQVEPPLTVRPRAGRDELRQAFQMFR